MTGRKPLELRSGSSQRLFAVPEPSWYQEVVRLYNERMDQVKIMNGLIFPPANPFKPKERERRGRG